MALLATDQNDFTLFKMMHIDETVEMMKGYIKLKPEHTEYYESFITHLLEIKSIYESQLIRTELNELNPEDDQCQQH